MARERDGEASEAVGESLSERQEAYARCFALVVKGSKEEILKALDTLPNGYERQVLKELSFGVLYCIPVSESSLLQRPR